MASGSAIGPVAILVRTLTFVSLVVDVYGRLPYNYIKTGDLMATAQARIEGRVTAKQKRLFEKAAKLEGVTLTDFMISSMQRAATQILQEHATLRLSERDQQAFVKALLNPPEPSEALRKAAKAYTL